VTQRESAPVAQLARVDPELVAVVEVRVGETSWKERASTEPLRGVDHGLWCRGIARGAKIVDGPQGQ
jgi:hypothetical protein